MLLYLPNIGTANYPICTRCERDVKLRVINILPTSKPVASHELTNGIRHTINQKWDKTELWVPIALLGDLSEKNEWIICNSMQLCRVSYLCQQQISSLVVSKTICISESSLVFSLSCYEFIQWCHIHIYITAWSLNVRRLVYWKMSVIPGVCLEPTCWLLLSRKCCSQGNRWYHHLPKFLRKTITFAPSRAQISGPICG